MSGRCLHGAGISMHKFLHSCRVAALGGFLLSSLLVPIAAKADQIVILVDNQGRKIYVNTGEGSGRVNWMTSDFRVSGSSISSSTPATPTTEIEKLVKQSASHYQVDPDLVKAVIQVESGFDPKACPIRGPWA